MFNAIADWLFDPTGLTPHGFCLLWAPGLIWTHAIADATIGLAYFTIPVALVAIVWRRQELVAAPVFWLFCCFIVLCGAGHWLDLLTLWVPVYGIEGAVKAATAVVSIATAIVLGNLLPQLLATNDALRLDVRRGKQNELVLRAARDAAAASARAKTDFLATMSHEIRSPMSGMVGVIELLRETRMDPVQERMAKMVHDSALGLLEVLNDILDFSKIEAGAFSITPEPAALHELVHHVSQPHAMAAARAGVALKVKLADGLPEWCSFDALRLRQILNNLLSNAVKFTAVGEIVLVVDVVGRGPAARLRFSVRDTGVGMSAEVLSRLFSPFMQADGSTQRDFGGTGLGLCISRRLAELHGGTLTAASRSREGSTFTLLLPLVPAAPPAAAPPAPDLSTQMSMVGGGRVLVVDDDLTNRWLSQRQLELLGLTVAAAENGEAALKMLELEHYDLLLTDCHMPRMDGVALARAVRASANPALRALPVIGITADVTEAQAERCAAAGMTALEIKPLSRERLVQLLSRHLPARAARALPTAPAPAAPDRAETMFDEANYRDLFAPGDPEGELWLGEFFSAAGRLLDELRAALDGDAEGGAGDIEPSRGAVAATAHRLVGSAFAVGAARLGHAARRLEQAAPREDPAALRALLAGLCDEFDATQAAMQSFIARFKSEATP